MLGQGAPEVDPGVPEHTQPHTRHDERASSAKRTHRTTREPQSTLWAT